MDLQLIGNIAKLNQTIESFKSNYRVELILNRNRFIRSVLLLTVIVTAVYIFCMVFFQANIEAVVAFAAAVILCFIISIVALKPYSQTDEADNSSEEVDNLSTDSTPEPSTETAKLPELWYQDKNNTIHSCDEIKPKHLKTICERIQSVIVEGQ